MKRANFHCRVWKQAHMSMMKGVDAPENHGQQKTENGSYSAVGFHEPIAPKDILELIRCGCTTGCKGCRCGCKKHMLCCTDMCDCDDCENQDAETFTLGNDEEEEEDDDDIS